MFINAPFSHLLTHFNFILRDNINQNIVSSCGITPTRLLSGNWDSTASSFKLIDTWSMHVLFLEAASEINRPWFHFWMNTYYKGSGLRFSNIRPMNNMNLSKSGKHREEYSHRAKMLIWKTHRKHSSLSCDYKLFQMTDCYTSVFYFENISKYIQCKTYRIDNPWKWPSAWLLDAL